MLGQLEKNLWGVLEHLNHMPNFMLNESFISLLSNYVLKAKMMLT